MEQNRNAQPLGRKEIDWMVGMYAADEKSELFNSLGNPKGHGGLPPVAFFVCGQDPLRDEALLYERHLRSLGTKTKLEVYPGVPHGFWLMAPHLKSGKKFLQDFEDGFDWLVQQGVAVNGSH